MTTVMSRGGATRPAVVVFTLLCPFCQGDFVKPWGAIRLVPAPGRQFIPVRGHRCLLCDARWRQS